VARSRAPDLADPSAHLPADFVFTYLADPVRRRTDIGATRMPDFRLDEGERLALALFLGTDDGDRGIREASSRHPGVDAALGGRIYGALRCGACHRRPAADATGPNVDLSREARRVRADWLAGWLAAPRPIRPYGPEASGARMPDFRLSPEEVRALVTYLAPQRPGGTAPANASARSAPAALSPYLVRRTTTFLHDRAACLGCHRLHGEGGEIGPPLDGVASRLDPAFVVAVIRDPAAAMGRTLMPGQPLRPRDAERLAALILQDGRPWQGAPPASLADPMHPAWRTRAVSSGEGTPAAEGARLYARHCAACHGAEGRADGWNAHNLPVLPAVHSSAELMARRVDDALYDGIAAGAYVLDGSPRMPAYGRLFTPGQIRALVAHIRTLCRCKAPAWSRDGR